MVMLHTPTYQTAAVASLTRENGTFRTFVRNSLLKFLRCDWGDTRQADVEANNEAVRYGGRLFARYDFPDCPDGCIWIITEDDRSATTVLFPSDY